MASTDARCTASGQIVGIGRGADRQLLERRVVPRRPVAGEAIGPQYGALDEARGAAGVPAARQLPAQVARSQLPRAPSDDRGGDPRSLGIELVARAQPGDDHPAPVAVGDREVLERRLGLAGAEQSLHGRRGDRLTLEDADGDRVGIGGQCALGRYGDVHSGHVTGDRVACIRHHLRPSETDSRCPRQ